MLKRIQKTRTLMIVIAVIAIVLALAFEIVLPIARDEIQKREDERSIPHEQYHF